MVHERNTVLAGHPSESTPVPRLNISVEQRFYEIVLRVLPYVVPATLILVSLPFVYLAFYAVPASDDFCKAALAFNGVEQRTIYDFVRLYYWGWSSRWVTAYLQGFLMHTDRLLALYPAFLLTVVASQFAALTYFFSVILRLSYRSAITVAALFYVVWLSTLESPAENIYWLTGASEYMLSLSFMLLLAGLLCSRGGFWKEACACVLAFLIPAQHEMAGTFLCVFLLVGVLVAMVSDAPVRRWLICLGAAVVSLGFVIGSPAAQARASVEDRHLWAFVHAFGYAHVAAAKGLEWMLNPIALLAGIYACLFLSSHNVEIRPTRISSAGRALLCVSGMGLVLLELFSFELAGGQELPDRAIGWLHFVFWMFFFLLILAGHETVGALGRSPGVRMGLIALLVLALVSLNFRSAVSDAIGPAKIWRQSNAERLRAGGAVLWAPLPPKPRLLMNSEVSPDSSWWENRCEANYLGIQSVAVEAPR